MAELKRNIVEVIFLLAFLLLSGVGYLCYDTFITLEQYTQQEKAYDRQLDQLRRSIQNFSDLTAEEIEEWNQNKARFKSQIPRKVELPSQFTYQVKQQNFYGNELPLDLGSNPVLNMLFQSAATAELEIVQLSLMDQSRTKLFAVDKELSPYLDMMVIKLYYPSTYEQNFAFIDALKKLPFIILPLQLDVDTQLQNIGNDQVELERAVGINLILGFYIRKDTTPADSLNI